jgi:hypothetical protein
VSWIRGTREQWMLGDEFYMYATKMQNSETYGKGKGTRDKFNIFLKQAIALGIVDILFFQFKFNEVTRVCR